MSVKTEEVFKGDIGTQFVLTLTDDGAVVDISASTTKQFYFRKPDGSAKTVTAEFVTDGTDGQLKYTTVSGDIDQAGYWEIQARIEMGGGDWASSRKEFRVHDRIVA